MHTALFLSVSLICGHSVTHVSTVFTATVLGRLSKHIERDLVMDVLRLHGDVIFTSTPKIKMAAIFAFWMLRT